jgi:hypothetical protein
VDLGVVLIGLKALIEARVGDELHRAGEGRGAVALGGEVLGQGEVLVAQAGGVAELAVLVGVAAGEEAAVGAIGGGGLGPTAVELGALGRDLAEPGGRVLVVAVAGQAV